MTKFCPACGEKLVDNANFCKSCGANLNSSAPRAKTPERPAAERSYTLYIIVAYVLAILIPLVGLIFGAYLITRKDSGDARRHGTFALIISLAFMALSFVSVFR